MSSTIDKRVVEMRFDNEQFESRTKTTLGTLEKLKNALTFSHASDGLDKLQGAVKGFTFNPLAAGVDAVQVKFSALEAAAFTALQNIVNRAVNAGIQVAKSLSVDQITAGFGEYELKMGSIQTIMASTGEDLETVNGYLDELNHYADKTIYSFSDMTSNIGKFTNAGVKLEDAVKAIQGVSNVAAVSGANANEASRAMYNFAQALSAGYVKLIDWKSIENANMATVEFKDALLDTALAMGTVVKEGDRYRSTTTDLNGNVSELFDATHMFNDSLSAQWLTTDVLVQALNNYSTDVRDMSSEEKAAYEEKLRSIGYTEEQIRKIEELGKKAFDSAQDVKTFSQLMDTLKESVGSGWAQTFEIIFGDFEEAKRRWTSVNEEIGGILQRSADARNALLEKAFGIPDRYLDQHSRNWDGLAARIRDAGLDVDDFVERCKDVGDQMGLIDKAAIKSFDDFKESLASGWLTGEVIGKVIAGYTDIQVDSLREMLSVFLDINSAISDEKVYTADAKSGADLLLGSIRNIWDMVKRVAGALKYAWEDAFPPVTAERIYAMLEAFNNLTAKFDDWVSRHYTQLRRTFMGLSSVIGIVVDVVKEVAKYVKDLLTPSFGSVISTVLDFTANLGLLIRNFRNWLQETGAVRAALEWLSSTIKGAISMLKSWYSEFEQLPWVQEQVNKVKTKFEEFKKTVVGTFPETIKKVKELIEVLKTLWKTKNFSGVIEPLKAFADTFKKELIPAWEKLKKSDFFGGFISKLTEFWNKIKSIFNGMSGKFESFTSNLSGFYSKIQDFGSKLSGWLQSLGGVFAPIADFLGDQIGNILAALMLLFTAKGIKSILRGASELVKTIQNGVKLITKPFEAIGGLFNAIKDALKSFSGAANAAKNALNGLVLLEVVLAIGALAYIMVKLKDYKPEDFKTGAIVVGALAIVVMAILGMIALINKQKAKIDPSVIKAQKDVGVRLLELAAALYLVVKSFTDLYKVLNGGNVLAAIGAVVGLIVALGVLLGVVKIFSKNEGLKSLNVKSLLAIVGAASALKMIVSAFSDLYELLSYADWDSLKEPLIAFGGAVAALLLILNRLSKTQEVKGVGVNLLLSVVSLKVLISVLEDLTTLDLSGIADHIGSFILVVGSFALLMKAVSKMSSTSGTSGAGLLAAAAAVRILVGAIKAVGQLELGEAVQGTVIVGAMLLFLAAFAKLADSVDIPAKTALTFLALSVSIGILAIVIAALSLLNKEDVETGTLAIDSMILCIAALIAVTKNAGNIKVAPLFVLITAFGVLSAALILILAFADDNEAIKTAAAALDSLMVCFAILIGLTGLVSKAGKSIGYGLVVVGVLSAVVAGLAYIIYLMVNNITDVDAALKCAEMLSLIMVSMAAAMVGCAAVGAVGPMALVGLGIGIAVIGIAAALLFAINELIESHPNIDAQLDRIGEVMYKIGDVFGQSVAGFLEGATSSLKQVGQNLSDFAGSSAGFFTMLNDLKPEAATGAKTLANALLSIAAADFVNTIVEKIGGQGFESFGETLKTFGQAMVEYSDIVTGKNTEGGHGIDSDAITASANAGSALAKLNKSIPKTGGSWQKFAGTQNISLFGKKIKTYGTALIAFNNLLAAQTNKFDIDAITATADAGMAMLDLNNSIPKTNGIWQSIVGSKNISDFGQKVKTFGEQIIAYADVVDGFTYNSDSPTKAISACAEELTGLASDIKSNDAGNILKSFGGDLSDFGSDISRYYTDVSGIDTDQLSSLTSVLGEIGTAAASLSGIDLSAPEEFFGELSDLIVTLTDMASLSQSIGGTLRNFGWAITDFTTIITTNPGVDSKAVEAAENVSAVLSSLSESIPESGSAKWSDVFDETDMNDLSLSLSAWGKAIVAYSEAVTGHTFDKSAIKKSVKAGNALSDLSDSIPKVGRGWDGFFDKETMDALGETLTSFANSMMEYSDKITGFRYSGPVSDVNTCGTNLSTLATTLKNSDAGSILKKFGTNLKTFGDKLSEYYKIATSVDSSKLTSVTTGIQDFISSLTSIDTSILDSFSSSLSNLALTGINNFCSAFTNARPQAIIAVHDFLTASTNAMGTGNDTFKTKGQEASTAFINSFNDFKQKALAVSSAKSVITTMIGVFEGNEFKFSEEGENSAKKYIKEFQNQYSSSKTAGVTLASNVLTGLSSNAQKFRTSGINAASSYVSAISSYSRYAYNAASALASSASSALSGSYSTTRSLGQNFAIGFINGMSGWMTNAYNVAYNIGRSAVNGLRRAIDAHSPSREAGASADDFGIGFVTNMLHWIPKAGDAAAELGEETVLQLNQAIAKIPDILSSGMDFDPVIRPVVDLTNAQQSVAALNGMFNQSIGVAADIASVTGSAVATAKVRTMSAEQPIKTDETSSVERTAPIYNTFNITSNNPEEVASVVSRRIQKQMERKEASWAQLSGTGSPLVRSR